MGSGRGRGMAPGLGPQLGSAWMATAALTETKTSRPPPSQSVGHLTTAMVDEDECGACGICVDVCPEHAISMDMLPVIDTKRCSGCGACIAECPNQALRLGPQTEAPVPAQGVAG